jgi:histidine triad (HIT) family protein
MPKPCPFCLIAGGSEPAHLVYEDDRGLAFLDRRPLFRGHTLLIPREHVETLPELPPAQLEPLFRAAQRLCSAVQGAMGAHGTFVAVNNTVSQSVPHLHIHIVPRTKGDGLKGFFWPRHPYASDEEMAEVAAGIRAAMEQ